MNLKKVTAGLMTILLLSASCSDKKVLTLKDSYKNDFLIGAALNLNQIYERDTAAVRVVKQQFSSIVAEDCMKSMYMQPKEGEFHFEDADKFVEFGEKNGMQIIGHTLVWHSQTPAWLFTDENGADVSREVMIERMKNHITTIVSRYKGRIQGWDVVNEAISDDGSWRKNKFYEIIGEEYISLAFQFAREADPDAELYYNDYNMAAEGKRKSVVEMVKRLQSQGIKVDGIGMQGHMGLDYPDISEFEKSIIAYSELGAKVMVTEMDITVLPFPASHSAEVSLSYEYQKEMNPYAEALPDSILHVWEKKYTDYFQLFLKHKDKISRVTLWGISDANSWRNDWPITGRTDYPLLFDRNYQPKPVVEKIINLNKEKAQ